MNEEIKNAVLNQLGITPPLDDDDMARLNDITQYGISGGFYGFIYYAETCEFFDANRNEILSMAQDMAQELGETISEMMAGFNCINGITKTEIEAVLIGLESEHEEKVKNALAWFAAEEVAREIVENTELNE